MKRTKPYIIINPGPIHLFWTTGVYYLWELSSKFSIVLIVTENYKNNSLFQKVISKLEINKVIFIPQNIGIISRHFFYSKKFYEVIKKFNPYYILQHNHVYPANLYLTFLAKKNNPSCKIVTFQNGQIFPKYKIDFKIRITNTVLLKKKHLHLPLMVIKFLLQIKSEIIHYLDFYLLPFLTIRTHFRPEIKLFSGAVIKKNSQVNFTYSLFYLNSEKKVYEKIFGKSEKYILIKHPLETCGEKCNQFLYNTGLDNLISILPSYGFIEDLTIKKKVSETEAIKIVSKRWISAIKLLKNKFQNYKIILKQHPNSYKNGLFSNVVKEIKNVVPDIDIVHQEIESTKLILNAKVVVSDVSTVLWLASFMKNKIVISLDIFGYEGGDVMKYYKDEGICYVSKISQLKNFRFKEKYYKDENINNLNLNKPSIIEFLSNV